MSGPMRQGEMSEAPAGLRGRPEEGPGPQAILEHSPVAIYATDAQGRITYYNAAAAELWGRRPRLGEDWWCGSWRLYWPDGRPMAHDECPMAIALRTGEPVRNEQAVLERPDGTRVPFLPFPTPLRDAAGRLVGAANMLVNLTDYKAIESTLRQREAELTDFVENTTIGLHWVGPDGTILWANRAEMEMLGYEPGEYIGRHIAEFHADDPVIDDILARLARFETIRNYEARLRCKDGSIKHVLIDSSTYEVDGKFVHTRCYTRDISDQKLLEQRLSVSAEISQILAEAHTLDEGAPRLLKSLSEHFDADIAELWLGEEKLACAAFHSRLDPKAHRKFEARTKRRAFAPGDGLPGLVWEARTPIWLADLPDAHRFARRAAAAELGLSTAIGLPVLFGRQCLGAIICLMKQARPADPSLLAMMASVGQKVGMFIERLRAEQANHYWAALVHNATDAIVAMSMDGRITSWNRGAEQMLGYSAEEAIGQPLSLIVPPDRLKERKRCLAMLEEKGTVPPFNTVRRTKSGKLIDVSISFAGIRGPFGSLVGTGAILRDVTKQKAAEDKLRLRLLQLQSVAEIGQQALASDDLEGIFSQAASRLAEGLGVEYATVLQLQPGERELLLLAGSGWPEGVLGKTVIDASLESQAGYTLAQKEPVIIEDFQNENRFKGSQILRDRGVTSGMSCVIQGDMDRPFGILSAHTTAARTFTGDDVNFLQSIANVLASAIARKTYQDRQSMLARELSHRVKNNLSVIQALASRSGSQAGTVEDFLRSFGGRLMALSHAQDLLLKSDWAAVSLSQLIRSVVATQTEADRFCLDIEDLAVNASDGQTVTLIVHELTTNALKHGALSAATGTVALTGRCVADGRTPVYRLSWRESGGPPVEKPGRVGFGSKLVSRTIEQYGGKLQVDWRREGLLVECTLPLSVVAAETPDPESCSARARHAGSDSRAGGPPR